MITKPGLLKLLLNINPKKADGPDNVPGKFLKICAYELVDVYQILFQASLDQGIVPSDWKEANVVPLFKKGDRNKAENYRPISLTSLSCKLLEHVVHSNIMTFLEEFGVLDDAQHGFRKKRSCISQLTIVIDDFAVCLKLKEQIDAILLDFSKAFDKVDHRALLLKLEHLGIRNSLLKWIESFLIGRSQKVLVEGMASDPKPVRSGVPQGTVLGPLFFLIYINDISKGLTEGTKLKLFADDSLLYRTIKTPNDSAILQKDLDHLQLWEKKWKMEFHPGKCQLLRVTNKTTSSINSNYNIHGVNLEKTDTAKYLGVVIDSKLRWKKHYNEMTKKASSILGLLKRNFSKCSTEIKSKCYTTLARPIVEYGCPVWDPQYNADIETIEKVQKRAARFATGNYCYETGNSEINQKALGWESLEERRLRTKLIYLQRARLKQIDIPIGHLDFKTCIGRQDDGAVKYARSFSDVNGYLFSFFPDSTNLWNCLPAEVRTCEDINSY